MELCADSGGHSVDSIEYLAVAIKRIRSNSKRLHIGVLFREFDNIKLLHVGRHYESPVSGDISKAFVWSVPPFDLANLKFLQTQCMAIASTYHSEGFPYGFGGENVEFMIDGAIKPSSAEPHWGFTCATFVISLFHSYGFKIVDFESWATWPEDKEWQRQIIQDMLWMDNHHASEQLKKATSGVARYRPDHVYAAATKPKAPHSIYSLKDRAKKVRQAAKKARHACGSKQE